MPLRGGVAAALAAAAILVAVVVIIADFPLCSPFCTQEDNRWRKRPRISEINAMGSIKTKMNITTVRGKEKCINKMMNNATVSRKEKSIN